jgi:hypothetical protein
VAALLTDFDDAVTFEARKDLTARQALLAPRHEG